VKGFQIIHPVSATEIFKATTNAWKENENAFYMPVIGPKVKWSLFYFESSSLCYVYIKVPVLVAAHSCTANRSTNGFLRALVRGLHTEHMKLKHEKGRRFCPPPCFISESAERIKTKFDYSSNFQLVKLVLTRRTTEVALLVGVLLFVCLDTFCFVKMGFHLNNYINNFYQWTKFSKTTTEYTCPMCCTNWTDFN
jgi:hypothetical protein